MGSSILTHRVQGAPKSPGSVGSSGAAIRSGAVDGQRRTWRGRREGVGVLQAQMTDEEMAVDQASAESFW